MNRLRQGLIQVYTGDGKGKTTAAFGLALRAVGRNLRVCIIQFMKKRESGEVKALRKFSSLLEVKSFGRKTFIKEHELKEKDKKLANLALEEAFKIAKSKKFDLLILDEINVALYFKLVSLEDVMRLIEEKSPSLELVLTGRYAPPEIIEKAHLVTEMKKIKHPYDEGIKEREGIEY